MAIDTEHGSMTGDEMVALSKKHTLFEWSAQSKVDPIPAAYGDTLLMVTDLRIAADGTMPPSTMADAMNGRNEDGSYGSMTYSFPAIGCIDSADPGLAGARTELAEDVKKAPILGPQFGPNLACTFWTARPAPQIDIVGKGAAPILVLGATGDPATPYRNAQLMAEQLDSAVLLTVANRR